MVNDYDCWHPEHEAVDVAAVLAVMRDNTDKGRAVFGALAADFPHRREACPAGSHRALDHAIMTAPAAARPCPAGQNWGAFEGRVLPRP